jgi:dienelactone hydrolase
MYEPFPGNYVWNLSVNNCLGMGGAIGEIDAANEKVREIARQGDDAGTEQFFTAWMDLARRVTELADEAAKAGHLLSAAEKYGRATAYLVTAERMQSRHYEPRKQAYRTMLKTMEQMIVSGGLNCERVEIPYGDASFPGLFVKGHGAGPRPCMIFCNGLDSVKEMIYLSMRDEFAKRGISCLMIDQPGVGEALRLNGLHAVAESERWASAALDLLQARKDVDPERIGMMGWSLGGYYAPRAVAFEKALQSMRRLGRQSRLGRGAAAPAGAGGRPPGPALLGSRHGVWGKESLEAFMQYAPKISLAGVLERITVPFLITHGANDRQIPLEFARQSYDEAVNSPRRELKIFTEHEGGVEHVSADNMEPVRSYIVDWVAERFSEM